MKDIGSVHLSIFYHWLWIAFLTVVFITLGVAVIIEVRKKDETVDEIKHNDYNT